MEDLFFENGAARYRVRGDQVYVILADGTESLTEMEYPGCMRFMPYARMIPGRPVTEEDVIEKLATILEGGSNGQV